MDSLGDAMKETRRPLVPMDDALRRRGVIIGIAGMILLFGSAVAVILTPGDLLVYLIAPMIMGMILLVLAFFSMRKAERLLFNQEHSSHSSRLKP